MPDIKSPNIKYVTISGRIIVSGEDYQRLVYLAHKYREKVVKAIR